MTRVLTTDEFLANPNYLMTVSQFCDLMPDQARRTNGVPTLLRVTLESDPRHVKYLIELTEFNIPWFKRAKIGEVSIGRVTSKLVELGCEWGAYVIAPPAMDLRDYLDDLHAQLPELPTGGARCDWQSVKSETLATQATTFLRQQFPAHLCDLVKSNPEVKDAALQYLEAAEIYEAARTRCSELGISQDVRDRMSPDRPAFISALKNLPTLTNED